MSVQNRPGWKRGCDLAPSEQAEACRAFVHRFTRNHRPAWALPSYKPQFADDADWLARTWFKVRDDGRLDRRHRHCQSTPTWPDGR